jgi:uncharacterized protein (TIGR02594 family)
MILPPKYAWLSGVRAPPRLLVEAIKLLGVTERAGPQHNPEIMGWAREVGLEASYTADEIPWCGLFAAVVAKRAGWPVVASPLWARSWARWEAPSPEPGLGDMLVFERGSGGHVGLYVGEAADRFFVLGGNQGDSVSIVPIARGRLLAARRPRWRVAQPAGVRPYRLTAAGTLSTNEA